MLLIQDLHIEHTGLVRERVPLALDTGIICMKRFADMNVF